MKIPYFFILTTAVAGSVCAAPRLPPVLDSAPYEVPAAQPVPSYDDSVHFEKLQNDISELKNKIQEQDEAITNLRHINSELQKKLLGNAKPAEAETKTPTLDAKAPPSLDAEPKVAAKKPAAADSEKNQYQRGSDLLKKGDYAQAIAEFQSFLAAHPTSKYADNAQYWTASALLSKGDKKAAIQAFDKLARSYPQSEKVPDALFKMGDTLLGMKNKAKAKEYFDYVIQNHPGTEGAKLAAKKKAAAKL